MPLRVPFAGDHDGNTCGDRGPRAGSGVDLGAASADDGPFAHPVQAHRAMVPIHTCLFTWIKAAPVIPHRENDVRVANFQHDRDMTRTGVLDHIVQRLLRNPIQAVLNVP